MWPDRVSNPGPPTYESGALPIALRGLAPWMTGGGQPIPAGLSYPPLKTLEQQISVNKQKKCLDNEKFSSF